ncbi:hypothetical protein BC830DRAFT_682115 [Chytriomyces sp. MP71]|nr:hypothetical protein BC830DRAFT_682115 [Chytriomyces sp. MP71]
MSLQYTNWGSAEGYRLRCDACSQDHESLKKCRGCKVAFYCGARCQRAAWRLVCAPMAAHFDRQTGEADARDTELAHNKEAAAVANSPQCTICLDAIERPVVLGCNHAFCAPCIAAVGLGTSSCPLCRSETIPPNLHQAVYQSAVSFITRAYRLIPSCGITDKEDGDPAIQARTAIYVRLSRNELNKLPELGSTRMGKWVRVNLHILEKRYQDALNLTDALLQENSIDSIAVEVCLCAAKAAVRLNDLENVGGYLRSALQSCDMSNNATVRDIYSRMVELEYLRGNYEKAIDFGNTLIEANKFYPGCYDYLLLSHFALKNHQCVRQLVKMARMFETPWDEVNRDKRS